MSSNPLSGGPFLPPDPRVEEPYRLTPRAAGRIAIVGVIAVVLFAILFFRLWALQVISGERYLETANDNQVRTYRIEPPRGPIIDARGNILVSNVPGRIVQLWPAYAGDRLDDVVARLSELLDVPVKDIRRQIRLRANDPLSPIVIKTHVHDDKANYLLEHQVEFPGVEVARTQIRRYEYGSLAAHLLGSVGEISQEELNSLGPEYAPGDRIGKAGIESAYDSYLRGVPGTGQIRFDSQGVPTGPPLPGQLPQAGYAVRLTLDIDLQRAAEEAIRYGMERARALEAGWAANGGAIVAMDPTDGAILALATNPTYDPGLFAGRADPDKIAQLYDEEQAAASNYPLVNRAVAGLYPPGSTFKPVTALAAIASGLLTPDEYFACTAGREIDGQQFDNWDPFVNEQMRLVTALARSCDTYFYDVGLRFYEQEGSPLQEWSRKMGFGRKPSLDVGQQNSGLLPTPEWRRATYSDPVDQEWTTGDSVQLAIGQGDLLVTPLQLTRFYALLANGGLLVDPYIVEDVEQPRSSRRDQAVVLRDFPPRPPRDIGLPAEAIEAVQLGLYGATHDPNGTAQAIYAAYPIPIAGKTGTAEKFLQLPPGYLGRTTPYSGLFDQSVFCGYGPTTSAGALDRESNRKPLVVCALIENGGHGGDAAAPAALQVFAAFWDVAPVEPLGEVYSD